MNDQEQRAQVLAEIADHLIKVRKLADSIELLTDAEHRRQVEVAFGLLSVDWKYHNQAKPSGVPTVAVMSPEELAKKAAADQNLDPANLFDSLTCRFNRPKI